jgi:MoxR-like ATPase
MDNYIAPQVLRDSILAINRWHPNTPLILVFARQKRQPTDSVEGGNQAVRSTYDALFSLAHVGISDDARKYYLHLCHGREDATPFAIRKPTANYGKTHQRIIKDTFGQQFLDRQSSGKYRLKPDFQNLVLQYLGSDGPIDLQPLVFFRYWNNVGESRTVGDLWNRFCEEFGTNTAPYSGVFTCSGLGNPLSVVAASSVSQQTIKQLVLPSEYGIGAFNVEFWRRFRQLFQSELARLKWQGNTFDLSSQITAALMQDQSIFLLGDPGTGKTTIVLEAILPALREAYGNLNDLRLCYYSLTPSTTTADLFGFQGLDGRWVAGPLVADLLEEYESQSVPESGDDLMLSDDSDDDEELQEGDSSQGTTEFLPKTLLVPRLLFLDEANRIDIEGLLSPVQAAFDRLQKRMEPPTVTLGGSEYSIARRVWRIYAGNSPVADSGRREQSRPFKRRCSVIIPPDPMSAMLEREEAFRKLAYELLEKASTCSDPEVSEPSLSVLGQYKDNAGRLEDLRDVLSAVEKLRRVALTVGLVESILLRTAAQHALQPEGSLDAALCVSLGGMISGDRPAIEHLAQVAERRNCPQFARWIREYLLSEHTGMSLEVDALL